jgi:hypothetical protein
VIPQPTLGVVERAVKHLAGPRAGLHSELLRHVLEPLLLPVGQPQIVLDQRVGDRWPTPPFSRHASLPWRGRSNGCVRRQVQRGTAHQAAPRADNSGRVERVQAIRPRVFIPEHASTLSKDA